MGTSRRALLSGMSIAVAGVLAGGVTGCRSSDAGAVPDPAGSSAPGGGVISVTHKFGDTAVPPQVKRVVTLGWNDQDFVLALGVVPVGVRAWFDNYNRLPWVTAVTGGQPLPTVASDEINFEAVAAARPELILAIYESIDRPTYDRLSEIAPTVVQAADYPDEETPWDVQLVTTGRALGLEDKAVAARDEVQAAIDKAKADHPEFAGKVLVQDFGPENGGHYLIGKGDPRRALLDALGFETQSEEGDLSEEKLPILDRDILFVVGATKQQMIKSELFAKLKVVSEDRALYTTFESNLAAALSYSGPTALRYALDTLVPQLANALNGRPVADLSDAQPDHNHLVH